MRVPDGVKCNNNQVCKLNKAFYELKQATRCWFKTFEKALIENWERIPNFICLSLYMLLDRGDISKNICCTLCRWFGDCYSWYSSNE